MTVPTFGPMWQAEPGPARNYEALLARWVLFFAGVYALRGDFLLLYPVALLLWDEEAHRGPE